MLSGSKIAFQNVGKQQPQQPGVRRSVTGLRTVSKQVLSVRTEINSCLCGDLGGFATFKWSVSHSSQPDFRSPGSGNPGNN